MKLEVAVDHIKTAMFGIPDWKLGCDMQKLMKDNRHVFYDYIKEEFNVDMDVKLAEKSPSCIKHDVDFGAKMAGFNSPKEYYEFA